MEGISATKRVVVIGGGITGLTAEYRLTQGAQARGYPLEVILLEASERLGGTIATHYQPISPEFYCACWPPGPGAAGVLSHGAWLVAVVPLHTGV